MVFIQRAFWERQKLKKETLFDTDFAPLSFWGWADPAQLINQPTHQWIDKPIKISTWLNPPNCSRDWLIWWLGNRQLSNNWLLNIKTISDSLRHSTAANHQQAEALAVVLDGHGEAGGALPKFWGTLDKDVFYWIETVERIAASARWTPAKWRRMIVAALYEAAANWIWIPAPAALGGAASNIPP